MLKKRWAKWIVGAMGALIMSGAAPAWSQDFYGGVDTVAAQVVRDWDELMHYALIGNWELAQGYGEKLLASDPEPVDLLKLAESDRYARSYRNLALMEANTPLAEIAGEILALVEEGRLSRRTDEAGIVAEVARLSSTTRGRMIAIERLKASGEWAVPVFIDALRDPDRTDEVAVIRWAMPQLGAPAVNPLVVALQHCREINIKVLVMDVLGDIGYDTALPYIVEIAQDEQAHTDLKEAADRAILAITRDEAADMAPAGYLYKDLGEKFYDDTPSLRVPANQERANIWFWDDELGLVKEDVPRDAFDELMTMRCCENAIRLDRQLSSAIALWLSAFFRLEAEGQAQPMYFGPAHADAGTYALTAGPEYLHQVLARALRNRNRPVALSAIQTLRRNGGQQSLLYNLRGNRPLMDALSYPDREVRFSAAIAIGGALPEEPFVQSEHVVSILAEALQQHGQRCAIVADPDQGRRNEMVSQLRAAGFAEVVNDDNFALALRQARDLPSIDLLVLGDGLSQPDLAGVMELVQNEYRLTFTPAIMVAAPGPAVVAKEYMDDYSFLEVLPTTADAEEVLAASEKVLERNQARAFAAGLADEYALAAGMVLEQLALTDNAVLDAQAAEAALLDGLYEERPAVQQAVVRALARLDSAEAQRATAQLSLDDEVELNTRLLALRNLAISAKRHGNLLPTEQVDALYSLVQSLEIDPQLRNLAAEAYGALNLPSARVSTLILTQAADNVE